LNKSQLTEIAIEKISRGEYQPRHDFDQESLQELAESLKSSGMIQPLILRPIGADQYELVAGERRWRAAQLAGMMTVPCIVRPYTDEQTAAVTIIENLQRKDLNPIEEAQGYLKLIDEFSYIHEEVAAIVGKSRVKITNALRLLRLDPRIQELLIAQKLTEGHGKVLAGLPIHQQYDLASRCADREWSVRQLEQEIRKQLRKPTKAMSTGADPDIASLERTISETIGTPVSFDADDNQQSGWLKIRYYDPETLAGLLDKMGINYEGS
jgi:ParB family chromosome partitioning protein